MKYLLLSVLVVSLVGIMSVPDAFAKMYTDPDNRFSIEYPYGWIKELGNEDWLIIDFLDKYNWDAFFRVEFYEDISYAGTGDSNILREIIAGEREYCNGYTYQVDGIICYNYKVNDSSVVYTDENRKAYLIDQQYTKQYSNPDYPGEYLMRSFVLETHVGNDVWYIDSEIDGKYVGQYLDKVIKSINSFKLLQGQLPTSTYIPPPAPTPPTESVTSIPHWVKSNAGWWADGTINDSSFLQGIEYLINEGIIVIPPTTTSGASGSQEVPAWVKKNASWWVDGTIDDATFVSGIQYLVQVGIIQVG